MALWVLSKTSMAVQGFHSWWDEADNSRAWQSGVFYGLCAAYSLVGGVAAIQLMRIELRVPEYGWTIQKVFHLMNFIVNAARAVVFGFHYKVFTFKPKVIDAWKEIGSDGGGFAMVRDLYATSDQVLLCGWEVGRNLLVAGGWGCEDFD